MSHEYDGVGTPSSTYTAGRLPPSPSVSPASFILDTASQGSAPRLGDFTRVLASRSRPMSQASSHVSFLSGHKEIGSMPTRSSLTPLAANTTDDRQQSSTPSVVGGLGNFSKIFQRLSPPGRSTLSDGISRPVSSSSLKPPIPSHLGHRQVIPSSLAAALAKLNSSNGKSTGGEDSESDVSTSGVDSLLSGPPPTTPPTSWEGERSPTKSRIDVAEKEDEDANSGLADQIHRAKYAVLNARQEQNLNDIGVPKSQWLCDWLDSNTRGPRRPVLENLWTRAEAHEYFCNEIVPLRAHDMQIAHRFPQAAANGIHIFLDYSNINISFQQFLRHHYGLPENARLSPAPNVSLSVLHQLLIRGRQPKTLSAGGSIGHKDRHEPYFVQELRNMGYVVDLRERVRAEDASFRGLNRSGGGKSSSDETTNRRSASYKSPRFKEEFVDETLQSRIAASTLDYLDTPGTLIFVTGDGKPAPYADGFVKYAERALRRGFNVEVVSWSRSLSTAWDEITNKAEWEHGRFRVIELDQFWKSLIPVFATD